MKEKLIVDCLCKQILASHLSQTISNFFFLTIFLTLRPLTKSHFNFRTNNMPKCGKILLTK